MLLEVRSVSLRLCMRAVGVDDVVRALAAVLRRHRVPAANFVGHSFGTFVVAHMRKLFPETVSSVLLCDPVCPLTPPPAHLDAERSPRCSHVAFCPSLLLLCHVQRQARVQRHSADQSSPR